MTKTRNILMLVIIVVMMTGCSQTASVPRETTETGGTLEEWKEKMQDDPEALRNVDKCKELMENAAISCVQYEGFTLNNIMEITDFTADEPYSFQDSIPGGCNSDSAVGETHEPEETTIQYGTDGSSSYQVVCSSICVWWQCKEEKEFDQPPAQKIFVDDGNDAESATVPGPKVAPTPTTPAITSKPSSVSMPVTKKNCYPSYCTVFQNIIITSSTSWTSTPPGFGSLREGFVVSPDFGPAGSTTVAITYRYQISEPNDGFIRFRTTTIGVYAEVPVIVR